MTESEKLAREWLILNSYASTVVSESDAHDLIFFIQHPDPTNDFL